MRRIAKYLLLVALIFCAGTWTVTRGQAPSPGSLDPSFGTGGVASTTLEPNLIERLTTQKVGTEEMIIASTGLNRYWTIARHRANGLLDTSFAYNAKSRTGGVIGNPFTKGAWVGRVVVQPDGKLVVAGTAEGAKAGHSVVVIRYLATGQKDTSFGTGGLATVPVPGAPVAQGLAAVLQSDGGIVVVGRACDLTDSMYCGSASHPWSLIAVRLSDDGTIDNEFGSSGVFSYRHPTSLNASNGFPAVAIQDLAALGEPDPQIVITTTAWGGGTAGIAVVLRLTSDGTLDPEFGEGDGWAQLAVPGAQSTGFTHMAIDSQGRIVATGTAHHQYPPNTVGSNLVVARFERDGQPDTSFNGLGFWSERWQNGNAYTWSAAVQPDDSILVAGSVSANTAAAVWRFLPSGVLDSDPYSGFGSDGWLTLTPGQFNAICLVHKTDGTNAFVVGGRLPGKGTKFYWSLWRYFY